MLKKWIDGSFVYDGAQLHSLYAYLNHGMLGDSIVSWRGPCRVSFETMVDGEDLLAQSAIEGSDMVHFIVEKFDCDLYAGVGFQRLLTAMTIEVLKKLSPRFEEVGRLQRDGDDIFLGSRKLSISVATRSPVSVMIHFAVNVSNAGTPVETLALQDLGVDPQRFSEALMAAFCSEMDSIQAATRKVRPVS